MAIATPRKSLIHICQVKCPHLITILSTRMKGGNNFFTTPPYAPRLVRGVQAIFARSLDTADKPRYVGGEAKRLVNRSFNHHKMGIDLSSHFASQGIISNQSYPGPQQDTDH